MILRCFALSYYLYCLRLRCLVSFSFYSTIKMKRTGRARMMDVPAVVSNQTER
ncbi:Uncharacterised protein [Neisseria animalis]|nr:Uncharacterised protein [Neisseria animalis]